MQHRERTDHLARLARHLGPRFVLIWLATTIYVLLSAGAFTAVRVLARNTQAPTTSTEWLLVALAHGLALSAATVLVRALGNARVNPAVVFAEGLLNHADWRKMPLDFVAQLLGGITGALALLVLYGHLGVTYGQLGAVSRAPGVSLWQAFTIEALGTGALMATATASTFAPKMSPEWSWLALGLTVAAMTMLLGPATGATMNPARAFGPDLVESFLRQHVNWGEYFIAYLAGPVVGCVCAGLIFAWLMRAIPDDAAERAAREADQRGAS